MQTSDFDEFETLLPGMTEDDVMDWFQKRLNRAPEALDVYKVSSWEEEEEGEKLHFILIMIVGCKRLLSIRCISTGSGLPSIICKWLIK